ncbi:CHC2 zinc finger domain-containing protein [Methylobacterium sp. Leaf100]|uniref:DUF7146 domain-containing protein n=1 Tax=Methylobacterium sp. Leaf100 TaxID=1736252 RepID=UPI0006F55D49|nr:CHC2 zinc finger domain-containing protein [Methylobacterium sp. Leaf100]KQP36682.1 hypothetical protein ASF25_01625 [Methylobacterium sp. Leaf100]
MSGSSAFEAWVEEARAVTVEEAVAARGSTLKRSGHEQVGPCPLCGGHDGFSINPRKGVFNCRRGGVGGDAIALVQHLDGCEFRVACEILTGRPPPNRDAGETAEARAARVAALAARRAEQAEAEAEREVETNEFRDRELARCRELWLSGVKLTGTPAEAYLRDLRCLIVPDDVWLRCALKHPYWEHVANSKGGKVWKVVHEGPALLAPVIGPGGRFAGLHATWIDLARPSGKVELFHPDTGELLPAKKVRGSAKGGHIPLVRHPAPTILFLGEGIETVLSVWRALVAAGDPRVAEAAFWSGYSLGNIGGRAAKSVPHPSEATIDRLGRRRARPVPGPVPDLAAPSIPVPATLRQVWELGDSDSDRTLTENALARGAARIRHQVPGCTVRVAWAPEGEDFNDVLRRAAA